TAMGETARQPGKTAMIAYSRVLLWAFAVINLHLLVQFGLMIGEDLAGFDWAVPSHVLSLSNPIYRIVIALLTLLLLLPYFEATNYLLHVDARTRYEGLDLRYRVERCFPASRAEPAALGEATGRGAPAALGAATGVLLTLTVFFFLA